MWWILGLDIAVVSVLVLLWYSLCLRWNRRRGRRLLANLESAFASHGHVCGVEWLSASQFKVRLRLSRCAFTQSCITVRMYPLHKPFGWMIPRLRRGSETLTFEADLVCPPSTNLEICNHRRIVKTKARRPRKGSEVLLQHLGPFILTSRRDWQRDIATTVQSFVNCRECEVISVSFHRKAPHFSATLPLAAIAGLQISRERVFESLQELASSASAARL